MLASASAYHPRVLYDKYRIMYECINNIKRRVDLRLWLNSCGVDIFYYFVLFLAIHV